MEDAEEWIAFQKMLVEVDPNNFGLQYRTYSINNPKGPRLSSDRMGGYCNQCNLKWGTRKGFLTHAKKFHSDSFDFYDLSPEL